LECAAEVACIKFLTTAINGSTAAL